MDHFQIVRQFTLIIVYLVVVALAIATVVYPDEGYIAPYYSSDVYPIFAASLSVLAALYALSSKTCIKQLDNHRSVIVIQTVASLAMGASLTISFCNWHHWECNGDTHCVLGKSTMWATLASSIIYTLGVIVTIVHARISRKNNQGEYSQAQNGVFSQDSAKSINPQTYDLELGKSQSEYGVVSTTYDQYNRSDQAPLRS